MEYYQQAFDSSPDGLLVVDPQGLIVQANAQACTLFGYASGELDQQMIEALVPKHRRRQHIGHREHYGESPHPRAMGGQGLQLAGLRKDGSEFSVDVMLSPLRGNIGPMTLCVVRDVTERVQTQEHAIYPLVVSWFVDGRLEMRDGAAWLDGVKLPPQGYAAEE